MSIRKLCPWSAALVLVGIIDTAQAQTTYNWTGTTGGVPQSSPYELLFVVDDVQPAVQFDSDRYIYQLRAGHGRPRHQPDGQPYRNRGTARTRPGAGRHTGRLGVGIRISPLGRPAPAVFSIGTVGTRNKSGRCTLRRCRSWLPSAGTVKMATSNGPRKSGSSAPDEAGRTRRAHGPVEAI